MSADRSSLLHVLDAGCLAATGVGDKSVFAATSGPDSEAGFDAPETFGHFRQIPQYDNALFIRRVCAVPRT